MLQRILELFGREPSSASKLRHFSRKAVELHEQHFRMASSAGIPRGLRWLKCTWPDSQAILVRDRQSGSSNLLVAVNVSFEAIEGGDMEDVTAVGLLRDATAVFAWTDRRWQAVGRTLFNMNPDEAAERLATTHERL